MFLPHGSEMPPTTLTPIFNKDDGCCSDTSGCSFESRRKEPRLRWLDVSPFTGGSGAIAAAAGLSRTRAVPDHCIWRRWVGNPSVAGNTTYEARGTRGRQETKTEERALGCRYQNKLYLGSLT